MHEVKKNVLQLLMDRLTLSCTVGSTTLMTNTMRSATATHRVIRKMSVAPVNRRRHIRCTSSVSVNNVSAKRRTTAEHRVNVLQLGSRWRCIPEDATIQ